VEYGVAKGTGVVNDPRRPNDRPTRRRSPYDENATDAHPRTTDDGDDEGTTGGRRGDEATPSNDHPRALFLRAGTHFLIAEDNSTTK